MSDHLTAFIFARGGSKGLPHKNIKVLAGKPLIAWAIETALKVSEVNRVVVSTEDPDIADIAREFGAEVPFIRPKNLASDNASEWDAWRHALLTLRDIEGEFPDPFISVPTTAPLRLPDDIRACISTYNEGGADVVLAVTEAHRNPWFNMVTTESDGTVRLVNEFSGSINRRQDAPSVRDVTTVAYVANPHFILENNRIFDGIVRSISVPIERAIDIDTLHDFAIAEFLMNQRIKPI
jgi:CMP-N-acetylneuraminic acid synthetase